MISNDKAKLLGLFFWGFAALNILLVGVIAVIYIAIAGTVITQMPRKAGEPDPQIILPILIVVFLFVFIFTLLFSIPKVVAGYGLRKHTPWARTWAIVASIMSCLSFPVGTAIGVFGLVFLFSDEGKAYFEDPAYGQLSTVPDKIIAPPPNSWR